MTALPSGMNDLKRPIGAVAVLSIVLAAMLLTAGCIGGDVVREQDLIVIKLNHNGSPDWIREIDSGGFSRLFDNEVDDEAADIIQTDDEGYILAGGRSQPLCNSRTHTPAIPTLIRLSENGSVLWEKDYSTDTKEGVTTVFQTHNSGFDAITRSGRLMKINGNGDVVHNHRINIGEIENVVKTDNESYLILGHSYRNITDNHDDLWYLGKFSEDGKELWIKSYNGSDYVGLYSISELKNRQGYLFGGYHTLMKTDIQGNVLNISILNKSSLLYSIEPTSFGFSALFNSDISSLKTLLNQYIISDDGMIIEKRTLFPLDHPLSPNNDEMKIILSHDNEFLIAEVTGDSDKNWIDFKKVSSNGTTILKSNHIIEFPGSGIRTVHLKKVIETGDGGYLILSGKEKILPC